MTNQQGAPEAALRLRDYVERRKRAKQLDVNKVHAFDAGCDSEAELLLSDIETLLSLVEAQQPATSAAAAITDTEAFQNFHRLLCVRFGYVHDERDWRRDQLSLVEHIARQAQPSPTPQADSQPAPTSLEQKYADYVETVGKMLEAVGYTEAYALQWPKEKASVTFKRWFDEQISAARAPADSVLEDADPLQGAANWLAQAHGQFCVAVLQGCLMIGYNRAKRLHDASIAARKQGANHD